MSDEIHVFLKESGPVLCLDIGSSLQNAILARPGYDCEYWPRFTLPSPAQLIAQRIRVITLLKRNVWLYGNTMGGSFRNAVKDHLQAGLRVFATPAAARSLHNNPDFAVRSGIELTDCCPDAAVAVCLGDYSNEFWLTLLSHAGLPQFHMVLACARDSGTGKKEDRDYFQSMIREDNHPENWIFRECPENLQRLAALQRATGGPVADSTTAAILGAMCDDKVLTESFQHPVAILEAGSTHTVLARILRGSVLDIHEEHTDSPDNMRCILAQFEMLDAVKSANSPEAPPVFVYGPRQAKFRELGALRAPCGDMLHTGCLGLLSGWSRARSNNYGV